MTDDWVTILRKGASSVHGIDLYEAADEIARLRQQLGMPLETERENARLRAEVEALRADAERLDWMSQNQARLRWNREGDMCRVWMATDEGDFEPVSSERFDNPRAAIDAARKA